MIYSSLNRSGSLRNSQNHNLFPGNPEQQGHVDELMNRVLNNNDYKAFEILFTTMYPQLCRFCLKFVHTAEVAEELVSDVFYTIWKNREQIIVSSPKSYLFTAVRNRGFDYLRKVKRSQLYSLQEATHVATP